MPTRMSDRISDNYKNAGIPNDPPIREDIFKPQPDNGPIELIESIWEALDERITVLEAHVTKLMDFTKTEKPEKTFSPGPWKKGTSEHDAHDVYDANRNWIAATALSNNVEENIRLILAAPEMFDCVERLVKNNCAACAKCDDGSKCTHDRHSLGFIKLLQKGRDVLRLSSVEQMQGILRNMLTTDRIKSFSDGTRYNGVARKLNALLIPVE